MAYEAFSDKENHPSIEAVTHSHEESLVRDSKAAEHPLTEHAVPRANPSWTNWLGGWRGLVLGLGLGATIATVATHINPASSPSAANGSPTATAPTQSVTIATAKITPVTQTINVTGTVAAFDMLPILAEVSGLQIQQVLVDEGDSVEAGQVLAVLNSSVLQAQLNQARADVASAQAVVKQKQATLAQTQATQAQAETDLRRYQTLAESGAISRRDLDSYTTAAKTAAEAVHVAEADITSASADVQSKIAHTQELETQIAQTVVRAPASGIIAERVARVGNVTGTDKLFALIRENALELQAKVPESELAKIIPGAQVRITSDADSRIQVQGQVRDIAPLVDANTRQATIKIDLPADPSLRSGMFLKAAIAVQTTPALTIPSAAVIPQSEGQAIVYVLQDATTVRATPVTTGTRQAATNTTPAQIVITTGLQAGDRVVVEGAGYLKDGDRVTVVQP